MKKVLILGAKGMLGQALEAEFLAAGWSVTGHDREELDVTDFEAVTQKLTELKPDLVINSVAINAVDKIETEPDFLETAETINSRVPGRLAELCKTQEITLVHYSSDYVFAGDNENGYAEDATLAPLNKYGQTKAAGEVAVKNVGGKYYVIRLSKLFGKPAVSEGAKKSFVDTMLGLAAGGKTEFEVVDDESSSPTYAPDLARFTRELVESNKEFGIYHGANSGACTWYEWAKEIFALKNLQVEVRPVPATAYPRPAARPHVSVLLSTKIQVQRSWQEALQEYLTEN